MIRALPTTLGVLLLGGCFQLEPLQAQAEGTTSSGRPGSEAQSHSDAGGSSVTGMTTSTGTSTSTSAATTKADTMPPPGSSDESQSSTGGATPVCGSNLYSITSIETCPSAENVTFGQFTDDDVPDIVVSCPAVIQLHMFAGNGDGTFAAPVILELAEVTTSERQTELMAGMLDAGPTFDLVTLLPSQGALIVLTNPVDFASSWVDIRTTPDAIASGVLADVDGDDDLDLVARTSGIVRRITNMGNA